MSQLGMMEVVDVVSSLVTKVPVNRGPYKILETDSTLTGALAGTLQAVNLIPQGFGLAQRTGQVVNLKCISIGLAILAENFASIHLVFDKQSNGALPALADIFTITAGGSGTIVCPNQINAGRFKYLKSWIMSGIVTATNWVEFYDSVKLDGLQSVYKGTTGVIGSLTRGALLVAAFGGGSGAAPGQFQVFYCD